MARCHYRDMNNTAVEMRSEVNSVGDTVVIVRSMGKRAAQGAIQLVRAWAKSNGRRSRIVHFRELATSQYSTLAPSVYVARLVVR